MRVKAKVVCFAGGSRRRPGAVFNYTPPEGQDLPPFLEEVDLPATDPDILPPKVPGAAPRAGALPEGKEPEALSQVAEAAAKTTLGGVETGGTEPDYLS